MNRYSSALVPLKRFFWVATLLFLILSITFVIKKRERRVLEKTVIELTKANTGLNVVSEGITNRRLVLTTLKAQLAKNNESISPERLIYGKVDEIAAQFRPDDMTITTLERKDGNISLPFTLKFSNTDYCRLLNVSNQLQHSVFPFTPINTITLTQAEKDGKGVVEYTIIGSILTMLRNKP